MSPLYRSSIVYTEKIALRLNMFNAIRPVMTVTEPTLCLLSPQSTTSPLQPSPSSAWPSWSWAPCVWWGRVPVKAKAETTSSNLPACFTHSQVGLDFFLLFFSFPKKRTTLTLSPLLRSLRLHLAGGDATVCQTHDRERGHHLDRILLRLVLRLRLLRLRPPLPLRHRPPHPLHAPDAQESMGVLHGRWARPSGVKSAGSGQMKSRTRAVFFFGFEKQMFRFISRRRTGHRRVRSWRQRMVLVWVDGLPP